MEREFKVPERFDQHGYDPKWQNYNQNKLVRFVASDLESLKHIKWWELAVNLGLVVTCAFAAENALENLQARKPKSLDNFVPGGISLNMISSKINRGEIGRPNTFGIDRNVKRVNGLGEIKDVTENLQAGAKIVSKPNGATYLEVEYFQGTERSVNTYYLNGICYTGVGSLIIDEEAGTWRFDTDSCNIQTHNDPEFAGER